jgi:hypothetical protein
MVPARIDATVPLKLQALPVVVEQRASPTSFVIASLFIALAATVLLLPFGLLAAHAAMAPAAFGSALSQPVTALLLATGLLVAITFVALPVRALMHRTLRPGRVVVTRDAVTATAGMRGPQADWSEPLSSYRGVAHHIRTSLSGVQHEIVLVHHLTSRSVVLHVADRIGQPQVDAVASLLGVAQVPARTLYERGRSTRMLRSQQAELQAA